MSIVGLIAAIIAVAIPPVRYAAMSFFVGKAVYDAMISLEKKEAEKKEKEKTAAVSGRSGFSRCRTREIK